METKSTPRIYICLTQKSVSGKETDFSFVARQLRSTSVDATFEVIQLRSGETLWDRISPWITSNEIAGWSYVLTGGVMADRSCRDELQSALDRASKERGAGFPLIGLLHHGITTQSLPLAFRLRPCVHLADPNWREQVQAVIMRHPPGEDSEFVWKIHKEYGGDSSKTAIEVCPRSDVICCWRFAIPRSVHAIQWGPGTPGGGEISPVRFSAIHGSGRLENTEITWFGCEDTLSQTESAYVVFDGPVPDFVCFGRARTPASAPGKMEIFRLRRASANEKVTAQA